MYEPISGADFPAGPQKLNGPQALSFVRQRHELPRGDLDRVVRQQVVMSSLAHQVISGKTLSSPATMNRLQSAIQRSVVLSSGWDIMDFVNQLQKLAAGRVAFATIPVLDESGWSDDGMHSVVRVDPHQVQGWVAGLLEGQSKGKTEELTYAPDKTSASVLNDTDINGLASSVSQVLSAKGFGTGKVGNNDAAHVKNSQVQAAKSDDLGAQAIAKELGGLPVVAELIGTAGLGPGGAQQRLHRPGFGPQRRRPQAGGRLAPRNAPTLPRRRRSSPPAPTTRSASTDLVPTTMSSEARWHTDQRLSAAILDPMLRADPVGPRITYYDDATGERIELSAVTLANWAAKTGNLLRDELGGGAGSRVAVLLPAHWQTAAVLFGVWWIGAEVVLDSAATPTSPCAPPTGSTRLTPPAPARWRCCRWTRSAARYPICRSGSPTMRPRCGCTATRSSPSSSPARHWPAAPSTRCWPPAKSRRPQRV